MELKKRGKMVDRHLNKTALMQGLCVFLKQGPSLNMLKNITKLKLKGS